MRFSRDRRGYENTFVVHGERRKGKGRPRVLYWFRTPPGVKVGRAALDEDAIRLIEELNPQIEFDWTRILKGETSADRGAETVGQRSQKAGRRQDRAPRQTAPARRPVSPPVEREAEEVLVEAPHTPADLEPASDPAAPLPPTPAHARLGSEGVSRLRGRYAEVMARINDRILDEVRREELKSAAERLNPDNWVTDAEVVSGLEEYEAVFASLRESVGIRKRRRRRRGRPGPERATGAGPDSGNESNGVDHEEDDALEPGGDDSDGESL